ncbi:MAG: endopeptidase La [Nitrospirae bacterium]|nr:endopeptidase La [Nitrospirota bacterium]
MKFFKKRDDDEDQHEAALDELRESITSSHMPPRVEKIALQELEGLSRISPSTTEYSIGTTYIDYLVSLPWNKRTEDSIDLAYAKTILDRNHYGLPAIKERILEHLAVKSLIMNRKPRILVVDDEEVARKNLSHILQKEAYEVVTAVDGREAMEKLSAASFDLVISDLRMPGVNGMEILENIRLARPDTRVIMVTGYATVPSAVEAMKKGAFSYISKPFKLEEVRNAAREALDSRTRMQNIRGSVLCFAGPPGTGKTSMGKAIADALGRKFARIALGGLKDEAELRGHRRTYVGAKPGRIIEEIRRAESSNPVIMLDELDKIGRDFKGDPSSVLLEVLDSEQNHSFVDHYLDVPFDLSFVMFILTSNTIENIPAPLRDRMEVIEFTGFTREEKIQIASQFVVPRQIMEKGIECVPIVFTDDAIASIIDNYTHEAGTRNMEREIATVCRKIARELVQCANSPDARPKTVTIAAEDVPRYLGQGHHYYEVAGEKDKIGVATGLVLTEAGGDIIFVEAVAMKGKKELTMTGSLGEVMRESAQAALSFVRSNAALYSIPEDFFEHHDIHIHVPSGAIQKDGPSAGITIAMALFSLLTRRPARRDAAMTGEITLTGRILPVRGIKEKVLAAKRANVKTVILPERNKAEVDKLAAEVTNGMIIHLADTINEVIDLVLAV